MMSRRPVREEKGLGGHHGLWRALLSREEAEEGRGVPLDREEVEELGDERAPQLSPVGVGRWKTMRHILEQLRVLYHG